ncbi:hypothetical protein ES705_43318 [subsurface metagenome]
MVKMAKGPYMEFLRGKAQQTANNTYAETQIPTPTSKTENMAMLIHSVELVPSALAPITPANAAVMEAHLAKRTQAAVITLIDPDLIANYHVLTILNAVFNELAFRGEQKQTFDPPLLYPHANLFLGISTSGFASTRFVECRIGYTLEKVSREDFISALVE